MVKVIHSSARLPALGIEANAVILETLSTVMTFAFSRQHLEAIYYEPAVGHQKAWWRAFFEVPEQKAKRALIELAVIYRALDDVQEITRANTESFGDLYDLDGNRGPLILREVSNKIIHAEEITWRFDDPERPVIVCHATAKDRERFNWTRAEILVMAIAAICAGLNC